MRRDRVTGIGGIFFRSRDPASTAAWYRERLGIPAGEEGYGDYPWREVDEPRRIGRTVWSVFPHDTPYFGRDPAEFMVNYRVDDLDALLDRLRAEGVPVSEQREEYEFGRFGWVTDPEGRRVELWEPAGEAPDGHSFLFRAGCWRAEGDFTDEEGRRGEAKGRAVVEHEDERWEIRSVMEVAVGGQRREIRADYSVQPFTEADALTTWLSENPAVGTMQGTFTVVGDTILSTGATREGGTRVLESLVQLDDDAYAAKGAFRRDGELASRWRLRLERE